jgi:hypothetical protein
MRFGGHQTFTIRDGWLHKGMEILFHDPLKLVDEYAADYLGVGRNMAKSINHWLVATNLAQKKTKVGKTGRIKLLKDLEKTKLGTIIWKNDPFFIDTNTWWFLHINLVHNEKEAASWHWFFNHFRAERFQKSVCVQNILRHETLLSSRTPTLTTLDRDVSCFLNTYSMDIPSIQKDPEDEIESPFVELGLMYYYRKSGFYQVSREQRDIPYHVFMYAVASALQDSERFSIIDGFIEIPFHDLVQLKNSPGKIFLLSNERFFELLMQYEDVHSEVVQLIGLAGERVVRVKHADPIFWLKDYYEVRND